MRTSLTKSTMSLLQKSDHNWLREKSLPSGTKAKAKRMLSRRPLQWCRIQRWMRLRLLIGKSIRLRARHVSWSTSNTYLVKLQTMSSSSVERSSARRRSSTPSRSLYHLISMPQKRTARWKKLLMTSLSVLKSVSLSRSTICLLQRLSTQVTQNLLTLWR